VTEHTQWVRWQCGYLTHHQTVLMGWEGTLVFPHLVAWAKAQGFGGRLPRPCLEPRALSAIMRGLPEDSAAEAVRQMIGAGLLEPNGDSGFVAIHNYRKWQRK